MLAAWYRLHSTFDVANAAPFLRTNDYNHYFASWRQGTAPTAFIALNGGLGAVLGTPTDAVYPDAGTNGELRVPYRGFTSLPWIPGAEPTGLRLGGPGNNAPEGFYDDLVIWNRVVSFEELAALYGLAGVTVGWVEGIEINLLGLVAGVDLRSPALKLPGWGRVGV